MNDKKHTSDRQKAHLESFVAFHLKGLTPQQQDRFLAQYDLVKGLTEHDAQAALGAMLTQFEDERRYLSPELLAQIQFMSEDNIQRFTDEIKRLAHMRPLERESYLSDNEAFKQNNLYLGVSQTVEEALVVLGLKYPCSVEEIKQAYRQMAKTHHPDHGGDQITFMRVQTAYQMILKNMLA